MENYTTLEGRKDILESITTLENELSSKLGKKVALVAYSPVSYAALGDDAETLAMITELEKKLSSKTGKDIVLVAFDV